MSKRENRAVKYLKPFVAILAGCAAGYLVHYLSACAGST